MPRFETISAAAIWVVIAAASVVYIYLGYVNLAHLRSGFDLGTYTQILHNVSEHRIPPHNTLKGVVAWGDHAHFVMALFAPLFTLYPDPMFVVGLQVLAVTTSAYALYAIARRRSRNYLFAWAVTISYLLFFGVQHALDFDFHANTLTAAALAWSFYALEFRYWKLYWIMLGIGLLTREDAPVFYIMLSIYMAFVYRRQYWKQTAITATVSAVYFFTVAYWIMPMWQPAGKPLAYFDVPESTYDPLNLAIWLITHPVLIWQNMTDTDIARRTMVNLFASFGYLPLASPFTYLLALPNFLARFLSGEPQRHMMKFHYSVSLVSILSYGSILATDWMSRTTRYLTKQPVSLTIISSIAASHASCRHIYGLV